LTVVQIKKVRVVIDDEVKKNDEALLVHEKERNESLREIGNHLHESCIVSNDEVGASYIDYITTHLIHYMIKNTPPVRS